MLKFGVSSEGFLYVVSVFVHFLFGFDWKLVKRFEKLELLVEW